MRQTPPEVAVTYIASVVCWVLLVGAIYLLGRRGQRARGFWEQMRAERRWALAIAGVYLAAGLLGGRLDPGRTLGTALGAVQYFCQALVGLALARGLAGFEPLPVVRTVRERARPWRAVALNPPHAMPSQLTLRGQPAYVS